MSLMDFLHDFPKKIFKIVLTAIFFFSAAFLFAYFYVSGGKRQDEAENLFRQGLFFYQQFNYDAAHEYFTKVLEKNPNFNLSRRMLGYALFFSGKREEALAEWELLLSRDYYDPALKVHVENLKKTNAQRNNRWKFYKIFQQTRGYRYTLPTFIGNLPNRNIFFLSSGLLDLGSFLEVSADKGFERILRRISGRLSSPVGAAIGEKEIWISDYEQDKIHRLPIELNVGLPYLKEIPPIGGRGSGEGFFHGPAGIAFCNNFFYVADQGNDRIQKFNQEGNFIAAFSKTEEEKNLQKPFGITCFENGGILVSESSSGQIVEFDQYGNFLRYRFSGLFKRPRHLFYDRENHYLLIADEQQGVFIFDLETGEEILIKAYQLENQEYQLLRPYSATLDYYGNLFIADYASHQIIQYIPENRFFTNLDVYIENIMANQFPIIHMVVSVLDETGRYLDELTDQNFSVFENDGYLPNTSAMGLLRYKDRLSVLVVLDGRLLDYQDAIETLSDKIFSSLRQNDQVQIFSYSDKLYTETPFTNSKLRLLKGIKDSFRKNIDKQSTNFSQALYHALTNLLPEMGKKGIIWITDGDLLEKDSPISLEQISQKARVNHIPIMVVNFQNPRIPNYKNIAESLKKFAENSGGNYFFAFDKIPDLMSLLRQKNFGRYLISYRSLGKKDWEGQYMEVKVKVTYQGRTGAESSGYFIPEKRFP